MLIYVITKSQGSLFDATVHVSGSVRRDGTVVAPHMRVQKVAAKLPKPVHHQASLFEEPAPAKAPRRGKIQQFIDKKGGPDAFARTLAQLTPEQRRHVLEMLAGLEKKTVADVEALLPKAEEAKPAQGDLFAQEPEAKNEQEPVKAAPASIGDVIRSAISDLPSVPMRAPFPLTVEFNGVSRRFMARIDSLARGKSKGVVHLMTIKRGKLTAHHEPSWLALHFTLTGSDELKYSKTLPQIISDEEAAKFRAAFGDVLPKPSPDQKPAEPDATPDSGELPPPGEAAAPTQADERSMPFGVPAGITKQERRDINASVVRLISSGATEFTETEKALLRRYSGNGGCGDSLNEFYTPPEVAAAQWEVLREAGIRGGEVLEPSCGAGVYLHTAPDGFRVTGVELDTVSSSVAKALHGGRHEVVNSSLERFATTSGGRRFNAVLGNVPFGLRGSMLKDDKKELKTAEAYFVDTALDLTAPGGLVSLIVPTGLLDAKSQRKVRERLLRKGEFVGAIRMPNTAFAHSHTGVTSDIVFFRKRPDDVAGALATVDQATLKKLGVWDDEYLSGAYFEGRGAANVLGSMEPGWRAKAGLGQDITVNGSMAGVPEAIREWRPERDDLQPLSVQDIVAALGDDAAAVKRALGGAQVRPYANAKVGDTKVEDGITYVLQGDPPRWHRVDDGVEPEAVADARPLADEIDRLLSGRAVDRPALEEAVRAYVARHGIPSKSQELVAAAAHDKVLHRLIGAVAPDGRISDAVAGRVARAPTGSIETAAVTLAAEREDGSFTAEDLAERAGRDVADVEEALHAGTGYAYLGGGRWSTMDDYLTGDLWPKLDAAKAMAADGGALAEKAALQARKLEEVIGPKTLDDVEITMASGFVPTEVLQAWLQSKVDAYKRENAGQSWASGRPDAKVRFENSVYTVEDGLWDGELIAKYLNRTGVRKDDMPKIERLNAEFREWLLTSHLRDQVEDLYNRKFRGFVPRSWSKAPIDVPGLDTDAGQRLPNDYHWDSLRWALHQGKGIVADDVGLGKTLRGLMLARLAKASGKAKRPAFVVPKSVLANWVAEAEMWFPGSRVLVIGETYTRDKKTGEMKSKPDSKAERDRKLHDLTQNDYDFVFFSQPSFNDIDVDPITKGEYVNDDFWVQRGDKLGNAGDKKLNRVREAYKQAVAEREFGKRTEAIYWNDLGIDMMLVDEAHAYKNLYAARARFGESPKFLGGQGQSMRAFDMGFKARYLRDQNGGKGVYSLTATPTKNSPLEVYSMLSYIAPEEFERIGIRNSEEFLDRYCEFKNEKILGTNGGIEDALVTAGFKNLDELRSIMSKYIMRRTADDVGLQLPRAENVQHMLDMTPEQSAVYGELRALLAEQGKKDATGDAHVFSIMDKMAKAAMDLELLDPEKYAGSKSPKYDAVAAEAVKLSSEGGQILFCESVAGHEKIAQALVRAGVPREHIGIMNADEADSSAKRQNLADAFNSGKIRFIIGNKTMEEGVNLQKRTSDIHHLDVPWNAAAIQQRNGRGVRQGNKREAVRVHTWLTRGSFDGYRYQSMLAKKDWSDLLWNGGDRVENLARDAVSREDLIVAMSADPEEARRKLLEDKEAAIQRDTAAKTAAASEAFVRFQDLKRSYRQLKNKDTASAQRLRIQIERAKMGLADNPHFKAKGALDSNDEVLIHPATGEVVQRDQGLECTEADGSTSRWVVTGVNVGGRTVSMRPYADTTGHKGVIVPLKKLEQGVKPFAFDKDAEAREVGEKMTAEANAKLSNIKSYADVLKMPPAVLEHNYELIQRQLKDGEKKHSGVMPYGDHYMVDKATGKIEKFASYEHGKKHDTHDYLLPTSDIRERAIQAWIDARRGSVLGSEYVQRTRGAGSRSGASDQVAKRDYSKAGAGYLQRHTNPMTDLLNKLSPGGSRYGLDSELVKEAKARLKAEGLQRVRRAATTAQAIQEAMPMASTGTHKNGAKIPADALAMIWARAKINGDLPKPMSEVVAGLGHDAYAYAHQTRGTVHNALIHMARAGGHAELAESMERAGGRHYQYEDARTVYERNIPSFGGTSAMYRRALAAAERGGFADESASNTWSNYGYDANRGKTKRQVLGEKIAQAEFHEKSKEAA